MRKQTTPGWHRRRTYQAAAAFAVVALAAAACGSSSSGTPSSGSTASTGGSAAASAPPIPAGPIKIGMIAALSGDNAAIGNYQKAVQGAIADYINAHGGIAGHQVQLVVENSESDPAKAVSGAEALAQQGVVATVYNDATQDGKDQILAIEQKNKIIGVGPESLIAYDNGATHPYYFSDNPLDPTVTAALANYVKTKNLGKVAELGDSTPFSQSLETQFKANAAKDGVSITKVVDYPTTATSMTTQLSELKASGANTLALWCSIGCGQVFDSLRQIGWKPTIISDHTLYYVGYASVKNYAANTFADCPASVAAGGKAPAAMSAIVKAVAAKLGGESVFDQGTPINADGWYIIKYAIEHAHSTNGDALRAAIQGITNQSFTNPQMKYTFSAAHHGGVTATASTGIPICGFTSLGDLDLPVRVS